MADLEIETAAGVVWVRINRPRALNAITTSLKVDLLDALEAAERDPEAVCFVLTGAGRAFCAGADTKELELAGGGGESLQASLDRVELTQRFLERLQRSRLATIAAVNGVAAGGGISLALGCDLTYAAESARFKFVFGARGLVPDGALSRHLVAALGRKRALTLALTCADLGAIEAKDIGLVDEVVADDDLPSTVGRQAADIVARGAGTVALTKRTFAAPQHADLALEALVQATAISRTEARPPR